MKEILFDKLCESILQAGAMRKLKMNPQVYEVDRLCKRLTESNETGIPKKIIKQFESRTKMHISYVGQYCRKIAKKFPEFEELNKRAEIHDKSKWKEPERMPYIWLTLKFKCQNEGGKFEDYNPPEDIDAKITKASEHHVKTNSHHPEFHCKRKTNLVNKKSRDSKTSQIIDATKMPRLDIAEMVADWCGMAKELDDHPKDWADKNVNKKWKFTDEQKFLIYQLIEAVW